MCSNLFSRVRVSLIGFLLLASSGTQLFAEAAKPSPVAKTDVATMSGMKSLVPTLVAVGWGDFFLDQRQSLRLSEEQSQQLYWIRARFLVANKALDKEMQQAELKLYQDLDSGRVSSDTLDLDLQRIGELKEASAVVHFRAILEAINVLNHQQHAQADQLLKLRLEMLSDPRRDPIFAAAGRHGPKSQKKREYHWSSAFTPQQLGWRAW